MATFTSYIMSEDSKAQAEFYMQALGGEIAYMMKHGDLPECADELKDKVIHMCFSAAGIRFFMSDSVLEPLKSGNSVYQCVEFATEEEARSAFGKLAAGGKVTHPLEPAFWGALHGQLEDKFGIRWMISTEASSS